VELLRPAGPDLARRLVAALLLAPADEREAIVSSIESKMVELYAPARAPVEAAALARVDQIETEPRTMNVIDPPVQRDGFVEQMIHTYEVKEDEQAESDEPNADDRPEIVTRPPKPDVRAG